MRAVKGQKESMKENFQVAERSRRDAQVRGSEQTGGCSALESRNLRMQDPGNYRNYELKSNFRRRHAEMIQPEKCTR